MSASRIVACEDDELRVEAVADDKTRSTVQVRQKHPDAVLGLDTINPCNEKARTRFITRLPQGYQARASALLLALAAKVAEERSKDSTQREGASASPPTADAQWPESVVLSALLADLAALISKYVILTTVEAVALALWAVHTHCVAAADYTPYIWVRSATPECGKSTLLELLARLTRNSKVLLGTSPAYLFRVIEKHAPTVFLDEIDQQFRGERGEYFSAILSIFNSGYKRGQTVGRIEKGPDGTFADKDFHVFCPKVFAGIGRRALPDQTASRTLRIDLRKATPAELATLPRPGDAELDELCAPYRARIVRWAADNLADLTAQRPEVPPELRGRPSDVTRPLLAIADMAGEEWARTARAALLTLYKKPSADTTNLRVTLLRDFAALFDEKADDFVLTSDAVSWLNGRPESPYAELNHNHGLTGKRLAELLGEFDIKPEKHRGSNNQRGYFKTSFAVPWAAYLTERAAPIPSAPSAPSANGMADSELEGSGSELQSAPYLLPAEPSLVGSTSGADQQINPLPPKSLPVTALADGADGADGEGTQELPFRLAPVPGGGGRVAGRI